MSARKFTTAKRKPKRLVGEERDTAKRMAAPDDAEAAKQRGRAIRAFVKR